MNDMTLLTNSWNFPVETWNLAAIKDNDPTYHNVPESMARCIVRTDTNEVLGVHGSKYRAIKHDDVVNSIFDAISSANISKDFTHKIEVFDNGAKMRGTIDFDDLVIAPALNDHIKFQIIFFNSYDGSWSFGQQAQGLRLWCLNGCTTPDTVAKTMAKHTTNVNVTASASKIEAGVDSFFNSKSKYQQWMQEKLEHETAERFFKATLAKVKTPQTKDKWNNKQLDSLMSYWRKESRVLGNNKWALYNACTYWATHTNESSSPANTRRLRENQLAKFLPTLEMA